MYLSKLCPLALPSKPHFPSPFIQTGISHDSKRLNITRRLSEGRADKTWELSNNVFRPQHKAFLNSPTTFLLSTVSYGSLSLSQLSVTPPPLPSHTVLTLSERIQLAPWIRVLLEKNYKKFSVYRIRRYQCPLPWSQQPATCPNPETDQFIPRPTLNSI